MTQEVELTEEEAEELVRSLGRRNSPEVEVSHNVHSFLNKAATTKDTTKLSNVTEEELGYGEVSVRGLKKIALFCDAVGNKKGFANYFSQKAEILNATSLGKNAELLKLAVMQKKVIADETRKKNLKKGLFGNKENREVEGGNMQYLDGRY